ncbi:hypothetical protein [Prosthecochloris vibrioformis]|uniref:Organic solvent tolerance-like N-terminal domain-containing protein n=1 Tax=Prosthecochloris vibrioformis TaxID=1098 RepID=A0A5C4RZV1_PROVB|nr:hypothetical protein [Prosthecochloris vibrioformis]TNJ36458.1 hypothetical protein FGF68_06900 [Prosthecochloris vibrioformis]
MNISRTSVVIFILSLLCGIGSGASHTSAMGEDKKIILQRADALEGGSRISPSGRTEPARTARGRVVMEHGDIRLTCDRATEFMESGLVELEGNLRVSDPSMEIRSLRGYYYPEEEKGEFLEQVQGKMPGEALSAVAEKALIDNGRNRVWLFGNAVAWHGEDQLSADTIMVQLSVQQGKRSIEQITGTGMAFLCIPDTLATTAGLYNQLKGEKMVITLTKGAERGISGIDVDRQGEMLYNTYDNGTPSGVNYTSGRKLEMRFTENTLNSVTARHNVTGKQYPASFIGSKEVNLPGFRIRGEEEKPDF